MALILHIETATTTCSVALAENGVFIDKIERTEANIHASSLTVFIDELLKRNHKSFKELKAIAVSMGPGSYTGLRIGVSTAKGLCFALDIPLIAINTLTAMANGFIKKCYSVNGQTVFCPMIDARRMEVYTAFYNKEVEELKATEAVIINENSFHRILDNYMVYFFGDGAPKCEEILGKHINARIMNDFTNSAEDLIEPAYQKFKEGTFEDVAYFEPYYLKDYVAGKKKN
jgi:tRNA threonylcarbamoyladenosine biosynthesis protein TsaB